MRPSIACPEQSKIMSVKPQYRPFDTDRRQFPGKAPSDPMEPILVGIRQVQSSAEQTASCPRHGNATETSSREWGRRRGVRSCLRGESP